MALKQAVIFFICIISCIGNVSAQLPLLENEEALIAIDSTLDLIYNYEFEKAQERIDIIQQRLRNHPAICLLQSLLIYWKDRPLVPETETYLLYENYLYQAVELSKSMIKIDNLYEEATFYMMSGYSLLAELYSEEGSGLKVLGVAKKAYRYLKDGKEEVEDFPDFYFSTGLYNYYRVKYPELYPFYKSFLWLFASGDKDLGIEQLKLGRQLGVFTRNESTIYLYHIFLRYENNPGQAFPFIAGLVEKYPGNIRFKSLLTEVLVALGDHDQAKKYAEVLLGEEASIYKLSGTLFNAIIAEKNSDLGKAEHLLYQAQILHDGLNKPYFHYLSMIYATNARVADKRNNYDEARKWYKKALKTEPYVPVKEEAKEYINK